MREWTETQFNKVHDFKEKECNRRDMAAIVMAGCSDAFEITGRAKVGLS